MHRLVVAPILAAYVLWAGIFIWRSSVIAVDGARYFVLFDDAMISMRYAWNFSHGHGLVWNVDERVEGYTNLLMVLLMSIATRFLDKSPAVLAVQILGVGTVLLCALATMMLADLLTIQADARVRSFAKVLAPVMTLSYYPLSYWSIMGMETGLLCLLLLASLVFSIRFSITRKIREYTAACILLGLAYLARPDSAVFAMIILGFSIKSSLGSSSRNHGISVAIIGLCIYALFPFSQLAFRWIYYGELLPNTYVLKVSGLPLLLRIQNGVRFLIPYLEQTLVVWVACFVVAARRPTSLTLVCVLLPMSAVAYQIWVGGDPWPLWRILAPTMPIMFALFASELPALLQAIGSWSVDRAGWITQSVSAGTRPTRLLFGGSTVLALTAVIVVDWHFRSEIYFQAEPFQVYASRANMTTAVILQRMTTADAVIGVWWAGTVPYYTDRYAIDYLGKSDKYIARLPPDLTGGVSWDGMSSVPGHNKYDLQYSLVQREPTYTDGFQWGRQSVLDWAMDRYVIAEIGGAGVMLRRDSPAVFWDRPDCVRDLNTLFQR